VNGVTTASEFTTWQKAVEIPTDLLVYTDWNCNVMGADKLAHLQAEITNAEDPNDPHFDEPLQVIPTKEEDGKWLVVGGEHRTKIARSLQMKTVPCVIRHDLAKLDRKDLMLWSVRRNHLKGRIDAQKYAAMEAELVNHHGMTTEAARRSMLIDSDLAKALRASLAVRDNAQQGEEEEDENDKPLSSGVDQAREDLRSKEELLRALKIAEQDVLLDSADTVKHGYLFFAQGAKGQMHLVVDESEELHDLIDDMVKACKGAETRVDTFLREAISNALESHWETKE
jgi:ParB-like chromosome segregation protein Spo0J